jgi:hypothetical protein
VCPRSDLLWKEIGVAKLGNSRVKRSFLGKKSSLARSVLLVFSVRCSPAFGKSSCISWCRRRDSVLLIGEKMCCLLMHGFGPPGACASVCIGLQLWKGAAALSLERIMSCQK